MSEELNLGIVGLGTVGVGVIKNIIENSEILQKRSGQKINIFAVNAKNKDKDRGVDISGFKWVDDPLEMSKLPEVDVVVELVGGDEGVALELCKTALLNKKHVVTANKALIAKHGIELAKIAEENKVSLLFEAAVAGGIPIVKALKEGLSANDFSKVAGIMNGTCNYILTVMKQTGKSFEEVLKDAQDLGYAEADPTFDVDGIDTAHKLAILCSIAYGVEVSFDDIYIEGIKKIRIKDLEYAEEFGYKVKLLGICCKTKNGIEQRVHPALISKKHHLYNVDGVENAVYVNGDFVGDVLLRGPGAGEKATASSVVADIVDIAAGRYSYSFNMPVNCLEKAKFSAINNFTGNYYIRLEVKDQVGVLSDITEILGDNGVSLKTVSQKPVESDESACIVGITHAVNESLILKAAEIISDNYAVTRKPVLIRVE